MVLLKHDGICSPTVRYSIKLSCCIQVEWSHNEGTLFFRPSTNGNTTIEVELVFNNKASPEVTFSTADVLETMTTAATNTSAGGISFDPESVVVTGRVTLFEPMIKVTSLCS